MLFIDTAIIGAGVTLIGSLILVGIKAKGEIEDEIVDKQKEYNQTRIEEYEMKLKQLELESKVKQAELNSSKSNSETEGLF